MFCHPHISLPFFSLHFNRQMTVAGSQSIRTMMMRTKGMLLLKVAVTMAWCNGAALAGGGTEATSTQTRSKPANVADLKDLDEDDLRFLRQNSRVLEDADYDASTSSSSYTSYSSSKSSYALGSNFFAKTNNVYYDGYQQAWRYLGHLVKCGYPSSRYNKEDSHSHSNDNGNKWQGNNYCQRFLVWAAVSVSN
jgi:hypothetical protein